MHRVPFHYSHHALERLLENVRTVRNIRLAILPFSNADLYRLSGSTAAIAFLAKSTPVRQMPFFGRASHYFRKSASALVLCPFTRMSSTYSAKL